MDELELQRQISELDSDIQPQRDLWQGIERRVMALPQRRPMRERLLPLGVAASVVMALSALTLSIVQLNLSASGENRPVELVHETAYLNDRIALMGLDTAQAADLIDPVAREEIFQSLAVLVRARAALYEQIQLNPGDHRLRQMLVKVQAQERALLTVEFGEPAPSMYTDSL